MYIDQNRLDGWARTLEALNTDATHAEALLRRGAVDAARDFLDRLREASWHLLQEMLREGAEQPERGEERDQDEQTR